MRSVRSVIEKSQVAIPDAAIPLIEAYTKLLLQWNARINLISKSTESTLWQRHIEDAAQLLEHIPEDAKTLIDIGSGAGIPGLIVAIIMQIQARPTAIHLIERDQKKAVFLQEAIRICELKHVAVHAHSIEAITPFQADVVTARACAPLVNLLSLAQPFLAKESLCLWFKGCKANEEIAAANAAGWHFDVTEYPSNTSEDGVILAMKDVGKEI